VLGHLQVITINNIKEKTYTQLISGGPVCGAGFWFRISAGHGDIGLCVDTLMWLSLYVSKHKPISPCQAEILHQKPDPHTGPPEVNGVYVFLFNIVNCNDLKMAKHGRNM
jgi:hypothetical protein